MESVLGGGRRGERAEETWRKRFASLPSGRRVGGWILMVGEEPWELLDPALKEAGRGNVFRFV